MKQLYGIKRKLSLLLLIGIVILCVGFIFINCGKGPQSKIVHADSGQCAIDFSDTPYSSALYFVSNELLNRQSSEVTVEAWVKRKTSPLTGPIISRHAEEGVLMWVKDNEPKFAIRRDVSGTSTDFIVESNVTLSENVWYHIAGVLVNESHVHPSSTTSAACETAASETPHMDIYVDGVLENCASTGLRSMAELTCAPETLGVGVCGGDSIGVGVFIGSDPSDGASGKFDIIDDVRYWTTARTQAQIQGCMNQELVMFSDGDCGIDNPNLAAYIKLNECKGSAPSDWTGLGAGSKESPAVIPWDGGWVSNGAPITRKD